MNIPGDLHSTSKKTSQLEYRLYETQDCLIFLHKPFYFYSKNQL